jgi:TonB family protein
MPIMSSANSITTSAQSGRRFHARRKMEGLIYMDLGPDNGGILIDLGEGGLGFQSVVPVSLDQAVLLKFKVPGEEVSVEGYAEVAWLNESGKGGGLRFVELSENARAQIRGWSGELEAPEPSAFHVGNGAETEIAKESTARESLVEVREVSAGPEALTSEDTPAEISQSFSEAIKTQPPSPETPSSETNGGLHGPVQEPVQDVIHAADAAEQIPAAQNSTRVPEFAVEIAAEDANEPVATYFESPLPVDALPISNTVEIGTPQSAAPSEQERNAVHAVDAAASESTAGGISEIAEAVPHFEKATPAPSSSGIAARPQAPAGSQISAKPAGIPRMSEAARGIAQPSTATPAKPVRAQSSDFSNSASTSKRQRKATSSKPESSLPYTQRQDSGVRGTFGRQSPKPATSGTEWESPLDAEQEEFKPQPTLLSQALKIGIGGAAGACVVVVLVFAVPFLRTLVQTTANARSAGLNLANAPAFQVEVADLNNRRWILRSGGDAGWPFSDVPARRETQTAASNAARKESAKSSHADESDASTATETVIMPQPKLAKPAELALAHPLARPAEAPAAQLVAPSIFDGITPPIGSLTDRLPTSGPELPGIVSPTGPVSNRAGTLQSAVLLQRVAPIYPISALQAKVQGEVSVNATIGTDGVPKNLKVIKGDERLVPAAFVAIRQWRYRPATLGGSPIETQTVVTVSFELK